MGISRTVILTRLTRKLCWKLERGDMVDILSEIITCIVLKREKVEPRNMVIVKRDTIMRIIRRRLSQIYNEFNNRCRRVNWIGYNIIIFFFFFIVETKR